MLEYRCLLSDEWEILFSCEVETKPLPTAKAPFVGIELGIEKFAFLSDGNELDNPRFFRSSKQKLAPRHSAPLAKGRKQRKNVLDMARYAIKIHRKIVSQRQNFCHKKSREIVQKYQTKVSKSRIFNLCKKHK